MRCCIDCSRTDVELRPYGPGGAPICFDCGQKPRRIEGVRAAMRAAFDRLDVAVSMPGHGVVSPEEAATHVVCDACGKAPTAAEQQEIAGDFRRLARVPTADAPMTCWRCSSCRKHVAAGGVCFFCCLPILDGQDRATVDLNTKSGLKPYPVHAGCEHMIREVLGVVGAQLPTVDGWIERIVGAIRESARMGIPPAERERVGDQLEGFRLQLEAMGVDAAVCAEVRELVDELSPQLANRRARATAGGGLPS